MESSNKCVWLISFGDLLTLLLCFFLSTITMGPLNPNLPKRPETVTSSISIANSESESLQAARVETGTRIAQYTEREEPAVNLPESVSVSFSEQDFISGSLKLSGAALEKAKEAISSGTYEKVRFEVETCAEDNSRDRNSSWNIAKQRAFAIKSQVIDAQPADRAAKFSLRVTGSDCQLIRDGEADSGKVAGLKIYRVTSNG